MSERVAQKRQLSSSAGRDISVAEYEECSSKQASNGCIRAQLLATMLVMRAMLRLFQGFLKMRINTDTQPAAMEFDFVCHNGIVSRMRFLPKTVM